MQPGTRGQALPDCILHTSFNPLHAKSRGVHWPRRNVDRMTDTMRKKTEGHAWELKMMLSKIERQFMCVLQSEQLAHNKDRVRCTAKLA